MVGVPDNTCEKSAKMGNPALIVRRCNSVDVFLNHFYMT